MVGVRRLRERTTTALALCGLAAVASCSDSTSATPAVRTVTSSVTVVADDDGSDGRTVTVTAPATTQTRTVTTTLTPSSPSTSTPGSSTPVTTGRTTTARTTATPSRTTAFDPGRNIYLSKSVGQPSRLTSQDGTRVLQTFTVEAIRPGFACTAPGAPAPRLGRYLGVRVRNEISAQYRPDTDPSVVRMNRLAMKTTSGGITTDYLDGSIDDCLRDEDRVSESTAAGTRSVGWIVVDSKDIHGVLYLDYPPASGSGWQWDY